MIVTALAVSGDLLSSIKLKFFICHMHNKYREVVGNEILVLRLPPTTLKQYVQSKSHKYNDKWEKKNLRQSQEKNIIIE